ncbi:polyphosphate kinase [Putridiphycobacter roseus]|uniref:Polyphosphate kinase n=1 Tax=Putridiphycobacter roseus TaxID=2219161 RepID=A0A2W1NTC2_9FLAO|nr:PPK2 family polyphosphate kinase [Putridiphycobacter roseus]PZE18902.1 polyphosphate kinase [Putridiphycobacter roseus]
MSKIILANTTTKTYDRALKEKIKAENVKLVNQIVEFQRRMYSDGRHNLLIIFQGMDASGKDGATRKVFSGVNPLGIKVHAYKKPTDKEFAHDFLWRIHQNVPQQGMIQVFNRSHYEDILVPTIEGYFEESYIEKRYQHINDFEKLLIEGNNTTILKFYLHTSKEEQLERLTERIEIPEKYWKHNDKDWETRKKWDSYMSVYEQIFEKCNQPEWHIIPSDRNWEKENHIAKIVLKAFEEMDLKYPALDSELFKEKGM